MAHFDATTGRIVKFKPYSNNITPGWFVFDCGCCNGLEWGGETPRECEDWVVGQFEIT